MKKCRRAPFGRLAIFSTLVVSALLVGAAPVGAQDAAGPARLEPMAPGPRFDAARLDFGRELFFESRLSGDGSRSCASCHAPEHGFSDGEPLSRGYNHTGHFRNTPSLVGLRLKERLMWDGRYGAGQLDEVIGEMLVSPVTMNGNADVIVERVRQIPALLRAWHRAYGERTAPAIDGVVRALADFALAQDGGDTPVDAALRGDASALPALAAEGLRLFTGKAGCVRCHSGAAFSDGRAHRLGVPENAEILRDPERTISLLQHHASHGSPDPMAERSDTGLQAVTRHAVDRGRFATPSLRGVAQSAPYMHDGVLATLAAVVEFHDRGGGRGSELRPLGLDAHERAALVAFLEALSPPRPAVAPPPVHDYATVAGAGR